jgi:hypothetical protein
LRFAERNVTDGGGEGDRREFDEIATQHGVEKDSRPRVQTRNLFGTEVGAGNWEPVAGSP